MKCLALLLLFPCIALSITIREAIVDGDGSDEDQPLNEGKVIVEHYCGNYLPEP